MIEPLIYCYRIAGTEYKLYRDVKNGKWGVAKEPDSVYQPEKIKKRSPFEKGEGAAGREKRFKAKKCGDDRRIKRLEGQGGGNTENESTITAGN